MSSKVNPGESGNQHDVPNGNEHPLYNTLILESIMKWCPLRDIKSFRQVSKLWYLSSTKSFGESGVVGKKLKERGLVKFVKFLQENENLNPEVHCKFHMHNWKNDILQQNMLWEICGRHTKILTLFRVQFESAEIFRHIVFGMCPRLEKLNIGKIAIKTDTTGECNFQFPQSKLKSLAVFITSDTAKPSPTAGNSWMEIFTCAPFLKALVIAAERWNEQVQEIVDDEFTAIKFIRQENPKRLNLTHVELPVINSDPTDLSIPGSFFEVLTEPKLCFELISLDAHTENDKIGIADILRANEESLRVLILDGSQKSTNFIPIYNIFPANQYHEKGSFRFLTQISVSGALFSSLAFLKFTPNLKKLTLQSSRNMIENTSLSEMRNLRLEKCNELILNDPSDSLNEESVKLFIDLLPNLEILKMPMNNDTFSLVCRHWTNLVLLNISGGKLDECGLVGLDKEEIDLINNEQGNWFKILSTVRKANLASLKHLRKLYIYELGRINFQIFSYAAVILGIQQAPSLQEFYVPCSTFSEGANWYNLFRHATGQVNLRDATSREFESRNDIETDSSDESDTDYSL